MWKVVLCTNIAETSITVDDVTHVVDCGLFKEVRFDPVANVSALQEVTVSKASASQRAGRAGRVRPGHCWRMYPRQLFEGAPGTGTGAAMVEYSVPEIKRVPLEDVVLKILLLRLGHPEVFLRSCLDPPLYPGPVTT